MEQIERIFEGCIEEFKENGIKFTMESLARRIGMSKRTLYETVPSKTKVLEMAIDRTFEDVKDQQKQVLMDDTLNTIEKLEKLLAIVPTYANVLDYRRMNEIKVNYPMFYRKIQERLESDWEPTITLLEKAMDEGTMRRTNIVILRLLLVEVYEQLINGEILIQNNISYENAMKEMISIIFHGLLTS